MILDDNEVTERMESPLNLLNRLRSVTNKHKLPIISIPPTSSEVIENLEDKLAYGSIKSKAANIMIAAMDELQTRISETTKPESLAKIAESMSKVVNAEAINNNKDKLNAPQFHLYAPQFHSEEHYETIYARE